MAPIEELSDVCRRNRTVQEIVQGALRPQESNLVVLGSALPASAGLEPLGSFQELKLCRACAVAEMLPQQVLEHLIEQYKLSYQGNVTKHRPRATHILHSVTESRMSWASPGEVSDIAFPYLSCHSLLQNQQTGYAISLCLIHHDVGGPCIMWRAFPLLLLLSAQLPVDITLCYCYIV
ncbi:Transportin MOS14-like protein [Drosera capensis]